MAITTLGAAGCYRLGRIGNLGLNLRMSNGPPTSGNVFAVRHLAAWAPRLRAEGEAVKTDPAVLKSLIDAARRYGASAAEEFQAVARRCSAMFPLFGEPLSKLDFTSHRWVAGHREEAYSDWLKWILAQADTHEILHVFGVTDPLMYSATSGCSVKIDRESVVLQGHEGSRGRLDLRIRFGESALLVVEVKLDDAEGADTGKGAGYCRSVEEENDKILKAYVILVLDAEDEDYCGFKPRLWADTCIELRVMAVHLYNQGHLLKAAMILSFVSAVEQNLLHLQPVLPEPKDNLAASLALPVITNHLNRFLEAAHHERERD